MVEIITIGNELLSGKTTDTNATWIANAMHRNGFSVTKITTVPDKDDAILNALHGAYSHAHIVLLTGGLGPTNDDVTKICLCRYFDTQLVMNEDVLLNIEQLYKNRPAVLNELTRQQALVPEKCTIIQNRMGTAPILWFDAADDKVVVAMPGVPREMKNAITEDVIPLLVSKFPRNRLLSKSLQVYGIAESALALQLQDFENNLPGDLQLSYLPDLGIITLRLSGVFTMQNTMLEAKIEHQYKLLVSQLEKHILSLDEKPIEQIVGKKLMERGLTLSLAESCTGGNISHKITLTPGCSDYYLGGVVTYSNLQKKVLLDVSEYDLNNYGAVSRQVAEQMACGVRKKMGSNVAISVTGIAGPSGGTFDKPVGTVWIAVASQTQVVSKLNQFGNFPRETIISRATIAALLMLNNFIETNTL